jgi:hypothetical protein
MSLLLAPGASGSWYVPTRCGIVAHDARNDERRQEIPVESFILLPLVEGFLSIRGL